jgi:hypothetical protein
MGAEAPHAVAKARPLIQTLGHMESLFALVYATSLIAFWSGIATTIWRFVQMVSRLSALDAVRFAAVSYVLAALIGAWAFCLGSAGGLCALGGYIGTGLLVAGAVLLYRSLRARRELAAT